MINHDFFLLATLAIFHSNFCLKTADFTIFFVYKKNISKMGKKRSVAPVEQGFFFLGLNVLCFLRKETGTGFDYTRFDDTKIVIILFISSSFQLATIKTNMDSRYSKGKVCLDECYQLEPGMSYHAQCYQ